MRVSDAAKQLGMSTQTLRLALQQGKFTMFGVAVKTSPKRWVYVIHDKRFEDYINGRDYESSNNVCNDGTGGNI